MDSEKKRLKLENKFLKKEKKKSYIASYFLKISKQLKPWQLIALLVSLAPNAIRFLSLSRLLSCHSINLLILLPLQGPPSPAPRWTKRRAATATGLHWLTAAP